MPKISFAFDPSAESRRLLKQNASIAVPRYWATDLACKLTNRDRLFFHPSLPMVSINPQSKTLVRCHQAGFHPYWG
jgi:hypothetical protein